MRQVHPQVLIFVYRKHIQEEGILHLLRRPPIRNHSLSFSLVANLSVKRNFPNPFGQVEAAYGQIFNYNGINAVNWCTVRFPTSGTESRRTHATLSYKPNIRFTIMNHVAYLIVCNSQ